MQFGAGARNKNGIIFKILERLGLTYFLIFFVDGNQIVV